MYGGGACLCFALLIGQKYVYFFYFKVKLKLFVMPKAESNRDICFIKAVLSWGEH